MTVEDALRELRQAAADLAQDEADEQPRQRLVMDATVIRGLLVPAFMRLAGPANWWTPTPLHRFHRRFGIRELPEPVLAHDTTGAPPTSAAY
jgi:hypothetical protein